MCIEKLLKLLKRKPAYALPTPKQGYVQAGEMLHAGRPAPTLTLPYPEEPPPGVPVDLAMTREAWLRQWQVKDKDFWRTIPLVPATGLAYQGQLVSALAHFDFPRIEVEPTKATPGLFAHEHAHFDFWVRLTDQQRWDFATEFERLRKVPDPLLTLLVEKHPYALANYGEGHAETYRYMGHALPFSLRDYYPRLL